MRPMETYRAPTIDAPITDTVNTPVSHHNTKFNRLYFPFVLLVEFVILAAFVLFLVSTLPMLDEQGYLFYGEAPHAIFLEQYAGSTLITIVRWTLYLLTAGLLLPMMITIILELIRWRISGTGTQVSEKVSQTDEKVIRFDAHFRAQHLLIMVGVTLAGLIGLAQAFPDWTAAHWFLETVTGGLETGRRFHHYFAYIVDFTVFYFAGYLIYKFAVKKEKMKTMLPSLHDFKDFIDMNFYIFGLKKNEPEYGRYTFGQKIDFFLILVGIPTLSLTGLSMHYTGISVPVLTPAGVAVAAVLHRYVAIFLAWFVLSVHMYYAHFAPGLFPANTVIFTGKMSRTKYRQMYPLDSERL